MISRKEDLNRKSNESIMKAKYARCWNCHLNGFSILDNFGCCKRCGTNLKKYPTRDKHMKPDLSDERIAREVLGSRDKFTVRDENDQDDW
jgi:hypothetical protein